MALKFDPILLTTRNAGRSDPDGFAYAQAIQGDGATLTNYDAEQWLFSEWRANGVLSKISDGFIRGHNNNDANRRKVITRDQGTFPAGTVTPSAGYITYSSNGYGSFVTNMNAMPGISLNSHGMMIDLPLAIANDRVAMGVQNGLNHEEIVRAINNWYVRAGNESTAQFLVAVGSFGAGMLLATRTSATAGALYHYNGTTFSTVTTSGSLSGGGLAALPMFTGLRNANGSPLTVTATNTRERAAFITQGMTAAEAEIFLEALWTYYQLKGWV